jgi:hypothetical protein
MGSGGGRPTPTPCPPQRAQPMYDLERAKKLIEFICKNRGRPVVFSGDDCSVLNDCLRQAETYKECYYDLEREVMDKDSRF